MEKVWEQYDQILKQPKQGEQENVILGGETSSQQQTLQSNPSSQQNTMPKQSISENTPVSTQLEVEIVPMNPTSNLFLNIEEINPNDIFYIPMHKFVVNRGKKKRKIDESQALVLGKYSQATSLAVLWKGSSIAPTEYLGKLT